MNRFPEICIFADIKVMILFLFQFHAIFIWFIYTNELKIAKADTILLGIHNKPILFILLTIR